MTTRPLFRDAYLREARGIVRAHTDEGGIVLEESLFYPTGGGQPGDSGRIAWEGGAAGIATAVKGEGGAIVLVPDAPVSLPAPGTVLRQTLDWDRRYRHMRMHSALHLLSVVVPLPVTRTLSPCAMRAIRLTHGSATMNSGASLRTRIW